MKDYQTNPDRIDPDHALTKAAREVNDWTEDMGLRSTVENWLGMWVTLEEFTYLAEQRALRAAAVRFFDWNMGKDLVRDEQVAKRVVHSIHWPVFGPILIAAYMDGMAIGWRARMIREEEEKQQAVEKENAKQNNDKESA